jgi:hypothetical protein
MLLSSLETIAQRILLGMREPFFSRPIKKFTQKPYSASITLISLPQQTQLKINLQIQKNDNLENIKVVLKLMAI